MQTKYIYIYASSDSTSALHDYMPCTKALGNYSQVLSVIVFLSIIVQACFPNHICGESSALRVHSLYMCTLIIMERGMTCRSENILYDNYNKEQNSNKKVKFLALHLYS